MTEWYRNVSEHLLDEFALLDLRLGEAMQRFKVEDKGFGFDDINGLFISEDEAYSALNNKIARDNTLYSQEAHTRIGILESIIAQKKDRSAREHVSLATQVFSESFKLSSFEFNAVIICLAPEVDSKYEKIYAYLHDDVTKKKATMGLILDLLCNSLDEKFMARRFFVSTSQLFRSRILRFDTTREDLSFPLLSVPIKIDEHVTNHLLGTEDIDPQIASFSSLIHPGNLHEASEKEELTNELSGKVVAVIRKWQKSAERLHSPVFYFRAPYGSGKKTLAKKVCAEIGLPLLTMDVNGATRSTDFEEAVLLFFRETLLHHAVAYFANCDAVITNQYLSNDENIHRYEGDNSARMETIVRNIQAQQDVITILAGEKSLGSSALKGRLTPIPIALTPSSYSARKKVWKSSLREVAVDMDVDIDDLAAKFRFTAGQIRDAIVAASNICSISNGMGNTNKPRSLSAEDLYEGCKMQSSEGIARLAQRIEPRYGLDDIILPPEKKEHLREILSYVKHKSAVYDDWGFENKLSLGKGINIMFAGESGVGKSMAAEVISKELKIPLFRVQIDSIVSRWLGDSEQRISQLFKEAETSSGVILFDEADSLFGKRSEIKESRDRYANIETNFLLQKLEEHREIVILCSNLAKNIDEAFSRRMQFWLEFPFPDAEYRSKIWQNIFPKAAPLGEDVDFDFLARQFFISGGVIKNIAVASAFIAKELGSDSITMDHIVKAVKREFTKMGRPALKSEFGKYYDAIVNSDSAFPVE